METSLKSDSEFTFPLKENVILIDQIKSKKRKSNNLTLYVINLEFLRI